MVWLAIRIRRKKKIFAKLYIEMCLGHGMRYLYKLSDANAPSIAPFLNNHFPLLCIFIRHFQFPLSAAVVFSRFNFIRVAIKSVEFAFCFTRSPGHPAKFVMPAKMNVLCIYFSDKMDSGPSTWRAKHAICRRMKFSIDFNSPACKTLQCSDSGFIYRQWTCQIKKKTVRVCAVCKLIQLGFLCCCS